MADLVALWCSFRLVLEGVVYHPHPLFILEEEVEARWRTAGQLERWKRMAKINRWICIYQGELLFVLMYSYD